MNMNDDKQLNKRITVTISEDNMSAYIRLNALAIGDYDYTIDEVNASIAEVGVKMGGNSAWWIRYSLLSWTARMSARSTG